MCDKTFYFDIFLLTYNSQPKSSLFHDSINEKKKNSKKEDFCLHHATAAYHKNKNPKLQHQTAKVLLDASFLLSSPSPLVLLFHQFNVKTVTKMLFSRCVCKRKKFVWATSSLSHSVQWLLRTTTSTFLIEMKNFFLQLLYDDKYQ